MNRKVLALIFIFLLVLMIVATGCDSVNQDDPAVTPSQTVDAEMSGSEPENTSEEPETDKITAPGFTVYTAQGDPVLLSDFLGKPVVLNFWASWCGPCKMEMPDFEKLYLEYGESVHFVMVNLTDGERETVETASDFLASVGYTFPVYFDTQSEAAYAYSIRSIPTTFFIDAEGYAIAQATGAIDEATLRKGIALIYPPADNT